MCFKYVTASNPVEDWTPCPEGWNNRADHGPGRHQHSYSVSLAMLTGQPPWMLHILNYQTVRKVKE